MGELKYREREKEKESGPGSDGILISSRYRPASPAVFAVVVFEGRIEEPAPVASLTEKFQRFSRSFEWFFEVALPPIRSFFLFLPLSSLLLSSFDHPCPSGGPRLCVYICVYARKSFQATRLPFARGRERTRTPLGNLADKAR